MDYKQKYMKTRDIMAQFFKERNSSKNTQYAYTQSIMLFEDFTNTQLSHIMYLAETEQEENINWKHQSLKRILIDFRIYLYDTYKIRTAKQHLARVVAVFRHFEITIEKLPYFSTKHGIPSTPINPDKMVNRDILKLCIGINNPLLKAVTLFMSSSGMSKSDTLNLTVQDFVDATYEYHHTNHLYNALHILNENEEVIGYWSNYKRQKTGVIYYTFSSNESTTAIVQYLLSRERLQMNDKLFDISPKYFSDLFKYTNDQLGLGKNGEYSRFSSHMLRRYHATQLTEAGLSKEKIDILQGRKPSSIAYQSYIKIKPSRLREEYIEALPYIVIEDVVTVKTELEKVKDERSELKSLVDEKECIIHDYESMFDELDSRLSKLESRRNNSFDSGAFDDLI